MYNRNYKRVYNPKTGRIMFQRYDGGAFFHSMIDIKPRNLHAPGKTGLGHQPHHQIERSLETSTEEEADKVGEAILNRLKLRSGSGQRVSHNTNTNNNSSISDRIQKLISGSGLQIQH